MNDNDTIPFTGNGPDPSVPHLLAKMSSNGAEGTSYYQAVLIQFDPDLEDRIAKAYKLIKESDLSIRNIGLNVMAWPIAGADYLDRDDMAPDEDEWDDIDDLIDELEDGARLATPEEIALLSKAVGGNCEGEQLTVQGTGVVFFDCYEDGAYEPFSATDLGSFGQIPT